MNRNRIDPKWTAPLVQCKQQQLAEWFMAREELAFHIGKKQTNQKQKKKEKKEKKTEKKKKKKKKKKHTPRTQPDPFQGEN